MGKIRAVIVDDEQAAIEVIKELSSQITPDVSIAAVAMNGLDAMKVILEQQPDLVFLDIDMPLMNGLEVIEKLQPKNFKIIFTTGSAAYALRAIKSEAVDYLLKPIDPADFLIAINKVRSSLPKAAPDKKMRLLIRKGPETISKPVEEIVLFYTESRVVYVLDKSGKKFLTDKNMYELESELDPATFFRANRQYIINLNFIRCFKPYEKVKLLLELSVPDLNHRVIVSQKSAPEFRAWIAAS